MVGSGGLVMAGGEEEERWWRREREARTKRGERGSRVGRREGMLMASV